MELAIYAYIEVRSGLAQINGRAHELPIVAINEIGLIGVRSAYITSHIICIHTYIHIKEEYHRAQIGCFLCSSKYLLIFFYGEHKRNLYVC